MTIETILASVISGLAGAGLATYGAYLIQRANDRRDAGAGRRQIARMIRNVLAEIEKLKSGDTMYSVDWTVLRRLDENVLAIESVRYLGKYFDQVVETVKNFRDLEESVAQAERKSGPDLIVAFLQNGRKRDAVILHATLLAGTLESGG